MGCHMIGRLWYPQLDVYDAIRRIAGLLAFWNSGAPPSKERLYIADFYVANPPLLHKTHMSREVRNEFNALAIARPDKTFLSYPSAPILFQKMGEVQSQAFLTLIGKGLIDLPNLERGTVIPSAAGSALFEERFVPLFDDMERGLAEFIANSFVQGGQEISA